MKKSWKNLLIKYFDINNDGELSWWEYMIPFVIILTMEVLAEIIASLIV